jgi:hypothetical protein
VSLGGRPYQLEFGVNHSDAPGAVTGVSVAKH